MSKRIGVLTGGGDCPGLNAVLRAVVKTAVNKYQYEVIGFKDGYKGLVTNDYMELTTNHVSGILDRGGTILGSSNKDNPFHFKVHHNGKDEFHDMSDHVIGNLDILDLDGLILIGGDGTLCSAEKFSEKGVNVIGVPKTIDNDLSSTDITFGFMTAVDTATDAIDKLHSTAESHHRIMILEVMGRYAGWIALESGVAGGADVILIPEIPYNINHVADAIKKRKSEGKHFSIVVVAEGAKPIDGDICIGKVIADSPEPIRLGGIGNKLAEDLEKLTEIETRVTVLGHLQRGGKPSAFDRILSTRYGVAAVEFFNRGEYGTMVSLHGNDITSVPLSDAVGKLKTVDPDGWFVKIAKSVGVCFGA